MKLKNWFNYDPFAWRTKVSAGVVIILCGKELLFCHPTGHKWVDTLSFPKGGLEDGEKEIDAALRELKEETSISITKDRITNPDNPIIVDYTNKRGFRYKKVYLYTVNINSPEEIGLNGKEVPTEQLQLEEIDWCGFLSAEESKQKIFHRYSHLLDLVK
jgi:ADP-ribose pyrophosphatase YjhB (NUDIX family)